MLFKDELRKYYFLMTLNMNIFVWQPDDSAVLPSYYSAVLGQS